MRIYLTTTLSAALSSAATFTLADWQRTAPEFALYAVIVAMAVAVVLGLLAKAERATRSARASMMNRRAEALQSGPSAWDAILPLAWVLAFVLAFGARVVQDGGVL